MNKADIRKQMRTLKRALDDDAKRRASQRVFSLVEQTAPFLLSDHVLMYHSLPDELSTIDFIQRWHQRKHLYLPRVNGDDLDILPYDKAGLQSGAFNIEEPSGNHLVDISTIQLIIVPGVAFDCHGNRIGRGKGYYDRLLRKSRAVTIGVAYDCQITDEIEPDDFDIAMDYVIAESGIKKIK